MPKLSDPSQYSPEETERRLRKLMRGAFAGPPTQLKDIPKRNGESRRSATNYNSHDEYYTTNGGYWICPDCNSKNTFSNDSETTGLYYYFRDRKDGKD